MVLITTRSSLLPHTEMQPLLMILTLVATRGCEPLPNSVHRSTSEIREVANAVWLSTDYFPLFEVFCDDLRNNDTFASFPQPSFGYLSFDIAQN